MPSKIPSTAIRIEPELMKKFRYVSAYNGRSANKEIEQLIKRHVDEFEAKYGEIEVEEEG